MDILTNNVLPLVLTILIEGILLLILERKFSKIILYSILINCLTNIPLNIIVNSIQIESDILYTVLVFSLEVLIVFIEAFLYYLYQKDFKKSFLYSLALNTISFGLGIFIFLFLGYFSII